MVIHIQSLSVNFEEQEENMIRSIFICMMLLSFLMLNLNAMAEEKKKDAGEKDKEASWCDCYQTPKVDYKDFISDNSRIQNVETRCKKGYFITGLVQAAEHDPFSFGQYLIIESVECCKPCEE